MELFKIEMHDKDEKGKDNILYDGERPYFDMEVTPEKPFYKTKIFIILVSIISIILIGLVVFALIFIFFLGDKCDIENGYYIPEDKTKEKNCLRCDLSCRKCHGSISYSQCEVCFDSFIPSYENDKIKFCNNKCEEGKNNSCLVCDSNKNECTSCNSGYFMPEDEERKVDCQKCAVDYCDECSGKKNSSKCESCISSYSPIYEGNEIVKCMCEEGEKEKCMKCDKDKNECIACNEGYRLLNGKCFYHSIKAIYNTTRINESIYLINEKYFNYITNMIIDGNETKRCTNYVFSKPGNHKVFFFLILNKVYHLYMKCFLILLN